MFGESEMKRYLKGVLVLAGWLACLGISSQVWAQVLLEDIKFATLPDGKFEVRMAFSDTPPSPEGYTIDNPARIVLDLPGVESSLEQKKHALSFENARSAVVLSTTDRTRLILNMLEIAPYETRTEGNVLTVLVGGGDDAVVSPKQISLAATSTAENKIHSAKYSVNNVDFRRGEQGEGLVAIELSDPSVSVDISQTGSEIKLSFYRTELPASQDRRLDVIDFAYHPCHA